MIIRIPFWLLLLIVVPYWLHRRRQAPAGRPGRELLRNALFVYGLSVTYVTQFPLIIWLDAARTFNWKPFLEMTWLLVNPAIGFINIVGNIVMFIPLGFLVPLLDRRHDSFGRIALLGLICSAAIESLQYLTASRSADIDDLMLNTLGAVIGHGLLAAGRRLRLQTP